MSFHWVRWNQGHMFAYGRLEHAVPIFWEDSIVPTYFRANLFALSFELSHIRSFQCALAPRGYISEQFRHIPYIIAFDWLKGRGLDSSCHMHIWCLKKLPEEARADPYADNVKLSWLSVHTSSLDKISSFRWLTPFPLLPALGTWCTVILSVPTVPCSYHAVIKWHEELCHDPEHKLKVVN